jgi:NADH-quinone oxidoreductase subunit C
MQNCTDITGIDQPNEFFRFTILYQFLSLVFNARLIIAIQTNDSISLPSLALRQKSTAWSEREIWDMFGVIFHNNIDLRRLLTDYGFKGYPLRKDYPLTGFVEYHYNDFQHQICETPVYLTQNLRQQAKAIILFKTNNDEKNKTLSQR